MQPKPLDFFKNKLGELNRSRKNITKHSGANVNENATLAACRSMGENHTIAEKLLLPSAIILGKRMLGDTSAKLIGIVPLSNNTVQRLITDMADNIEETLLVRLRMSDMYDPDDSWIRNPFSCQEIEKIHGFREDEQDQLVDLFSCGAIKVQLNQ
ncbi:hypothetical protein QE152_g35656 [Popillia japonica]|uniref:Uncharacterized protein n=1 Tax=Popillia japonica TaxID=7064 RepID=A0AAW1IFJ6_POPJA